MRSTHHCAFDSLSPSASRRFATVTFKGKPVNTVGALPAVGTEAPDFDLTTTDLEDIGLDKFAGKRKVRLGRLMKRRWTYFQP